MKRLRKFLWLKDAIQKLRSRRLFSAYLACNALLGVGSCVMAAWILLFRRSNVGAGVVLLYALSVIAAVILNAACFIEGIVRPYHRIVSGRRELDAHKSAYADDLFALIERLYGSKERNNNYQLLQNQAQISALQQQINPHFLYNALDSVRGLAYSEGAKKTADMVEALAIFFRYTIGGKDDLVSLTDELQGIRNYLKIQQYRYLNPFHICYQIDISDEQALKTMLPRLTLQPIVENAIKHGLLYMKSDAEILFKIIPTQSRLIISIIDNGSGMSDQVLHGINEKLKNETKIQNEPKMEHGSGIALQNINARIKLHFGDAYGLSVFSTPGIGTEVQIVIPLLWERTSHDRSAAS